HTAARPETKKSGATSWSGTAFCRPRSREYRYGQVRRNIPPGGRGKRWTWRVARLMPWGFGRCPHPRNTSASPRLVDFLAHASAHAHVTCRYVTVTPTETPWFRRRKPVAACCRISLDARPSDRLIARRLTDRRAVAAGRVPGPRKEKSRITKTRLNLW